MTMRISGLASGLDTESIIQELTSAYSLKTQKYEKAQTKLSWTQDAWKSLNTKIYSLYTNISNLRFSSAYSTKKATISDPTKATVSATGTAVNGSQTLNVLSTAQSAYLTGGKLSQADGKDITTSTTLADLGYQGSGTSFQVKTKDEDGNDVYTDIELNQNTKISDVVSALQEAGLNANFDVNNGRFYMSAKATGANGNFEILADGSDAESAQALSFLGLNTDAAGFDGKMIEGTDAQIRLNGVLYTSDTNNFSINGLDITTTGITGDGDENAITITTDTDSQAIYDTIKDFLTEYNTLINEMTKLYNADSSYGYDPLTDDEKDAMSDAEIEKWETKIKDSLLRRDTTLNSVMSAMVNSMAQVYTINGERYSLSSFGISTLGFLNAAENEQNAYHIDGDEDDANTSGNEDKLMAAIKNDPDSVVEFMKQLTSGLYTAIDNKMKSTTLSSAYTVYNDKELNSQYSEYSKLISDWEDKVAAQEDYYYSKFAAMESALATLQSQSSSLSGLFG